MHQTAADVDALYTGLFRELLACMMEHARNIGNLTPGAPGPDQADSDAWTS